MVQTRQSSRITANGTSAESVKPPNAQKTSKGTKTTRPKSKVSAPTTRNVSKSIPSDKGKSLNPEEVHHFTIPHAASAIDCTLRPPKTQANSIAMVFTHGAGGNVSTPAVANFADGFASICTNSTTDTKRAGDADESLSSIICFTGSMNLKSRTAMFQTVADYCAASDDFSSTPVFGGRSMGSRAAVMAANAINSNSDYERKIEKLVLVSYPLLGQNNEIRDQILLDVDKEVEVLFVIGSQDHMCDLEELDKVRRKMVAKSWLVVVEGANHGMEAKPKKKSKELQFNTGVVTGGWARNPSSYTTCEAVGTMEGCEMMMNPPIVKAAQLGQGTSVSKGKTASKKRPLPVADQSVDEKPSTKKKRGAKKT